MDGGFFYAPDADLRQKGIDSCMKAIDAAVAVGSPSIRAHIRGQRDVQPNVDLAAETLSKLADYGVSKNVVVNLENDSPGSEDPYFIVHIIEKVNNPYLRALPDFGNSIRGHDQDWNVEALKGMFAHAFNMSHVKEHLGGRTGKDYHVDVARVFAVARAANYRGYFSMECDSGTDDPVEGTKQLVELTLKNLSSPA
jgi:sugar phosphate isomerase/epimerase